MLKVERLAKMKIVHVLFHTHLSLSNWMDYSENRTWYIQSEYETKRKNQKKQKINSLTIYKQLIRDK